MTKYTAMLPTEVPEQDSSHYLADPAWVLEQKHDGTRVVVVMTGGEPILLLQRSGDILRHTAATQWLPDIEAALDPIHRSMAEGDEIVLDGELLIADGTIWVFDMPTANLGGIAGITKNDPLWKRRAAMEGIIGTLGESRLIKATRQAATTDEKTAMYFDALTRGVEGVVAKRTDSRYVAGDRTTDWIKMKFVKSADVVVTGVERSRNASGRELGSIWFAAHDADGNLVDVGRCSAIGKPPVEAGDVIEVAFLYWTGTTTYQPRMMQVRADKAAAACTLDQFKPYSREAI